MNVETRLASDLLKAHPIDAAQVFERLRARDAAAVLATIEADPAAQVLQRMVPAAAAALLSDLDREKAADVLAALPVESAALCMRQMEESAREPILDALPGRRAKELRSTLHHPEGTAASLMDPNVLALPHDLTVREALARVREAAGDARYNLYVVDRDQILVGVINLRELLMARPGERLSARMTTTVHRLPARANRHAIASHPGWRAVHALPVVDEKGRYLGAVRYRTLRRLEEAPPGARWDEGETARALAGLLRAGAAAMLETVAASTPPPGGAASDLGRARDGVL